MKIKSPRSPLAHVKQLIGKLPPGERKSLIPFLAAFPDSGFRSYNLKEEFDTLKKFGTRSIGPDDDPADFLFELVFVRNLVSVQMDGIEVLRTSFFPDNFRNAFVNSPFTVPKFAEYLYREFSKDENKAAVREARKQAGIQEAEEETEAALADFAKRVAAERMKVKAERVAEQLTLHLPGMVGEMFDAAYKAQNWVDTQNLAKALGETDRQLSNEQFKKLVLGVYWRSVKPHLNLTRNTRTKPEWRDDDTLKQYAQLVNSRKSLTARIKEVYEDCDFDAGWMNDLREDSTFQRLSIDVPSTELDFAMKRVADDGIDSRQREPLSVACEMARREMNLPEQDIETLRNYFTEGSKILKKDRLERVK